MYQFRNKTKKLQTKDGLIVCLYNFYISSQNKVLFINDYSIIIGSGGMSLIHYDVYYKMDLMVQ